MALSRIKTQSLAADAVTSAKIADGEIVLADLAPGSADSDVLGAGSISTAKLQDGAVTAAKIADGAAVPSQTGNSGKFLTTDGQDASWAEVNTDVSGDASPQLGGNLDLNSNDITGTGNIDVTGTVTADDIILSDANPTVRMFETDATDLNTNMVGVAGALYVQTVNDAASALTNRIKVDHATGDISFYEDTGTTPKLFWDASAESLGIGTTSPGYKLDVSGTGRFNGGTTDYGLVVESSDNRAGIKLIDNDTTGVIFAESSMVQVGLTTSLSSNNLTINSSGNVGIGTSSPSGKLTVANGDVRIDTDDKGVIWGNNGIFGNNASDYVYVETQDTERMRITSGGNVGIGTSSPLLKTHILGGGAGTNGTQNVFALEANSTGTTAAGFGVGQYFYAENGSGNQTAIGTISVDFDNVTNGAEYSTMKFGYSRAGGIVENMYLSSQGDGGHLYIGGNGDPTGESTAAARVLAIRNIASNRRGTLVLNGSSAANGGTIGNIQCYNSTGSSPGNLGAIKFQRASANNRGKIVLQTAFNGTLTDKATLDEYGTFLVAKSALDATVQGFSTESDGATVITRNAGAVLILNRHTADGVIQQFRRANSTVGSIDVSTSGTTYNTTSDARLKTDIQPIPDATAKILAMNPVIHKWIADPKADAVHGFIAQEMQEVIPEAVSGDAESDEMMSMDYGRITPVIVAALQDALKEIEELKTRINELEAK